MKTGSICANRSDAANMPAESKALRTNAIMQTVQFNAELREVDVTPAEGDEQILLDVIRPYLRYARNIREVNVYPFERYGNCLGRTSGVDHALCYSVGVLLLVLGFTEYSVGVLLLVLGSTDGLSGYFDSLTGYNQIGTLDVDNTSYNLKQKQQQ
jgi:hypothetical protein